MLARALLMIWHCIECHSLLPCRSVTMLPTYSALQGIRNQAPLLLSHPLEPLAVANPGGWGPDEEIVWSSTEVPYMATYNQVG
jgi:hypothetical protein